MKSVKPKPTGAFAQKTPRFYDPTPQQSSAVVGLYNPTVEGVCKKSLSKRCISVFRSKSPRFDAPAAQHTAPLTYGPMASMNTMKRSQSALGTPSYFMASALPRLPVTKADRVDSNADAFRNSNIMSRQSSMTTRPHFRGNIHGTLHRTSERLSIHTPRTTPGPGRYNVNSAPVSSRVAVPSSRHVFSSKVERFTVPLREGPSVGAYSVAPQVPKMSANPKYVWGGVTKRF